jgi:type I restriction enzyme S subunit
LLVGNYQGLIQNAVTRGLDPNVPIRDSGVEWIGEIPAHWETKRVKRIFRLVVKPSEKNNNHELLSIYTDIGVKPRSELKKKGKKIIITTIQKFPFIIDGISDLSDKNFAVIID